MNVCCAGLYPFDERRVADVWWPSPLRFLVIGETPSPDSPYFYDPMPEGRRDPVRVRRNLLGGLAQRGLVSTPILAAFRERASCSTTRSGAASRSRRRRRSGAGRDDSRPIERI